MNEEVVLEKNPVLMLDDSREELKDLLALLEMIVDDIVIPEYSLNIDNLVSALSVLMREMKRIDGDIWRTENDIIKEYGINCFTKGARVKGGDSHEETA